MDPWGPPRWPIRIPWGPLVDQSDFQVHDSQPPDLLSYSALGVTPNDPPKNKKSLEKKTGSFYVVNVSLLTFFLVSLRRRIWDHTPVCITNNYML